MRGGQTVDKALSTVFRCKAESRLAAKGTSCSCARSARAEHDSGSGLQPLLAAYTPPLRMAQEGAGRPFLPPPQKCSLFVDTPSCLRIGRPDRRKPHWEAWRAEALQLPSEPGDMCGGFGSLAQQGFPARFPGRAPRRRGNVSWRKRLAAPAFFDKRTGACAPAFVIPEEGGTRPPVRFLPARPGALPEGRPVRPKAPPPTLRANRAAPWPSGRWCANPCP